MTDMLLRNIYNGLCSIWKKATNTSGFNADTKISDMVNDFTFDDYGRMISLLDKGYYSDEILVDFRLIWYQILTQIRGPRS